MSSDIAGHHSVFSESIPGLLVKHLEHLCKGSGISVDVIRERGYRSLLGKRDLKQFGFSPAQQRTPGILIPLWGVDGEQVGHQYRPDNPRLDRRGRPIKYESPQGSANRLDCPPWCQGMLGDPDIALWITEGSKKADALASCAACAISLTGVWGFKGKNELGGITFLADWDYIALRGRTVYLAFDSDIAVKTAVKKAVERLAEHLKRKKAKVLIIHLPQDGDKKVSIDDYLLTQSLEEAQKLATELGDEEIKSNERSVSGFALSDGTVGEMVVGDEDERAFVLVKAGTVKKVPRYEDRKVTYVPTSDPLVGQVIHFASTAVPYVSQAKLFQEIKAFIHRYLELSVDFEEIAALYVMLTWVYEFAPSVPYLRVIGDWGSGKTRFLQVVGNICFRPIFASGATTPSPIFRILEKFRGTLVFDEADFKDSSAWVEIIKLLNNGYRPGMPVLRAEKENGKWYPRSFQVFGPKLIATRFPFKDEALESRCFTAEMMPLTRDDVPRVLPVPFESEVKGLRAKLLTFRLANLMKLKGKTFGNEFLEPNLQPRLQEILIPLKAMLNGDQFMAETLATFVHRLQETLFSRRRESAAGKVLAALIELYEEGGELTSANIAEKVNQSNEEGAEMSAEKVGRVSKNLGFTKDRVGKSRQRIIRWDDDRVTRLAFTYGLKFHSPTSCQKPSQPPLLSASALKGADSIEDNFTNRPPYCPPTSEAIPTNRADTADRADSIYKDKGNAEDNECMTPNQREISHLIGMGVEQALNIWRGEGKPVIHLGPGENCFDLSRLLSRHPINPRHITAIKDWLARKVTAGLSADTPLADFPSGSVNKENSGNLMKKLPEAESVETEDIIKHEGKCEDRSGGKRKS